MKRPLNWHLQVLIVVGAAAILYLLSIDGNKIGFFHDDGIYIVTAKSVAAHSGYQIPSLPGEPYQTKYPPLYPLLLSLAWVVNPRFPANTILLILPSVLATLLCLFLAKTYFVNELHGSNMVSLSAVIFFAFNSRTAELASSALSEAVFTVISLCALWAAAAHFRNPSTPAALTSSLLVAATILTRSSGLALLLAIGIFASVRHRLATALPLLIAGIAAFGGWALWAHAHILNAASSSMTFYTSYSAVFWKQYQSLGAAGIAGLLAQNAFMLIPVSVPLVFLGLSYTAIPGLQPVLVIPAVVLLFALFALIAAGFVRHVQHGLDILHVYIACYLLFHVIWPYSSYDRFIMPLLPFICFFFAYEMAALIFRDKSWMTVLAGVTALWLYVNAAAVWHDAVQSREAFKSRANRDARLVAWIRSNTRSSDVFLCYPDPLYYLTSDRKTIAAEVSITNPPPDQQLLLRELVAFGSQYVIDNDGKQLSSFRPDLEIPGVHALLRSHPDSFLPVFSVDGATIYRVTTNYGR